MAIEGTYQSTKKQLWEIKQNFWASYSRTFHKLKLIDAFILFLALLTAVQILYYAVAGKDPFEGVLAGIFTSMGVMVFTGKK